MRVSVNERTREIGYRLTVGGLQGEVRLQFLTEAVVLSDVVRFMSVVFGCFQARRGMTR